MGCCFCFFVIWMKVVWRKQQSNATGCFLFVRRAVGQWTDSRLAALRSHKEPAGTTQCFIRCRGLFKMEVFHWSLSLWSICSRVHTHTHPQELKCKTFTPPPSHPAICLCSVTGLLPFSRLCLPSYRQRPVGGDDDDDEEGEARGSIQYTTLGNHSVGSFCN